MGGHFVRANVSNVPTEHSEVQAVEHEENGPVKDDGRLESEERGEPHDGHHNHNITKDGQERTQLVKSVEPFVHLPGKKEKDLKTSTLQQEARR